MFNIPRGRPQPPVPTFAQFVAYIVDQHKEGEQLNEHWVPMNEFCSPCQFSFDVIAKVMNFKSVVICCVETFPRDARCNLFRCNLFGYDVAGAPAKLSVEEVM